MPGPDDWYPGQGDPAQAPKYLKAKAYLSSPGKTAERVQLAEEAVRYYEGLHGLSNSAEDGTADAPGGPAPKAPLTEGTVPAVPKADPDAELDAALQKRLSDADASDVGAGTSFGMGMARGGTFNFGDEAMSALGETGVAKSLGDFGASMPGSLGEAAARLKASLYGRGQSLQPSETQQRAAEAADIPRTYAAGSRQEDMRRNLEREYGRGKDTLAGKAGAVVGGGASLAGLNTVAAALGAPAMLTGGGAAVTNAIRGTAPLASGLLPMATSGALGGGLAAGLDAAGQAPAGQRLEQAAQAAPVGAATGAVFAPLLGSAMGGLARFPKYLRSRPDTASLPLAESLDPNVETSVLQGIKVPKSADDAATAAAEGQGMQTAGAGTRADIVRTQEAPKVLGAMDKARGKTFGRIAKEKADWAESPQGQQPIPLDDALDRVKEMIAQNLDDQGVPVNPKLDKKLWKLRSELSKPTTKQDVLDFESGATGVGLKTRPNAETPRELTASQLEGKLDQLYAELKQGKLSGRSTKAESAVAGELRAAREQIPDRPGVSESYAAMRSRHHGELDAIERLYKAAGVDREAQDVGGEIAGQLDAVVSALKQRRLTPDAMAALERDAPEGVAAVRRAYLQGALDDLEGLGDPVESVIKGWKHQGMHRLDAVARKLAGTGRTTVGGGNPTAQTAHIQGAQRKGSAFVQNLGILVSDLKRERDKEAVNE